MTMTGCVPPAYPQINKTSLKTNGLLCAVAMLVDPLSARVCAQVATSPVLVVSTNTANTGAKKANKAAQLVAGARALPGFDERSPNEQHQLVNTLYAMGLSPGDTAKFTAWFEEMAGAVAGGGAHAGCGGAGGGGSGGAASPRDGGGGAGAGAGSGAGGVGGRVVTALQIKCKYGVSSAHAQAMLDEADSNGDGELDKLEFLAFCSRVEHASSQGDEMIDLVFEQVATGRRYGSPQLFLF
jgi:hypothetical protein